ncbi:hypothetical protein D9M73_103340 [compost metagenome]
MAFIGVIGACGGFVGFAEANQVGRDHAVSGGGERRHELAIEIGPARLAVQQQHRRGIARPLIEIVDAEGRAVGIGHALIVRRERIIGQPLEPFLGRLQNLHRALLMARIVPIESRDVKRR